jgi:multidrug efflux system membrane fusion protein
LLLGLAGLLCGCWRGEAGRGGKGGSDPPAPQVSTVVARKGDIGIYTRGPGRVVSVYTAMVKSRVDGQLMKVYYTEGQMVHEGDALALIDPRPYEAQLIQAEGQLARDKALLENARVDLKRYQDAYHEDEKAIAGQLLDTQVALVHQYEGAVKLDEGQVTNAQLQLVYAHITAPISGRIGLRPLDPGNIVHATDANPLAVIVQLQPITVQFGVPEGTLPDIQEQLRQGRKLLVEAFDEFKEKKLATGELLAVDNMIDTNTATIRLRALFKNDDGALFPSQPVSPRLLIRTQRDVTLVPKAAIQRDNVQATFVYVVQSDQTVRIRPVTVGTPHTGEEAVLESQTPGEDTGYIVAGLAPGEVIVSDNFNRLQDGAKVSVRTAGEESKPPGGKLPAPEGGSAAPEGKSAAPDGKAASPGGKAAPDGPPSVPDRQRGTSNGRPTAPNGQSTNLAAGAASGP